LAFFHAFTVTRLARYSGSVAYRTAFPLPAQPFFAVKFVRFPKIFCSENERWFAIDLERKHSWQHGPSHYFIVQFSPRGFIAFPPDGLAERGAPL